MPIINVKMAKGRTLEQKRQLVKIFTQETASILDIKPEWITVIIDEYERENWASGGNLHIDKFGTGFGKEGVR